jgi:hypothetical protein
MRHTFMQTAKETNIATLLCLILDDLNKEQELRSAMRDNPVITSLKAKDEPYKVSLDLRQVKALLTLDSEQVSALRVLVSFFFQVFQGLQSLNSAPESDTPIDARVWATDNVVRKEEEREESA